MSIKAKNDAELTRIWYDFENELNRLWFMADIICDLITDMKDTYTDASLKAFSNRRYCIRLPIEKKFDDLVSMIKAVADKEPELQKRYSTIANHTTQREKTEN